MHQQPQFFLCGLLVLESFTKNNCLFVCSNSNVPFQFHCSFPCFDQFHESNSNSISNFNVPCLVFFSFLRSTESDTDTRYITAAATTSSINAVLNCGCSHECGTQHHQNGYSQLNLDPLKQSISLL